MADALKIQADLGGPDAFDCRGGEPTGTHRTIFEIDPASAEEIAIAERLKVELDALKFTIKVPGFDSGARVVIRLMDGDGRA